MRPVDYAVIAASYDELPIRARIEPDARLGKALSRVPGGRVLDVGCGTGLWLARQAAHFGEAASQWCGVDPSEAMLARARARLPHADLRVAPAECLPFDDAAFRYVATRFAHHHFDNLDAAIDALIRVLEPGGGMHWVNIAPERMPGAWVFAWFPGSRALNARYVAAEALVARLEARGLRTQWNVATTQGTIDAREALVQAKRRDQSHLYALDDDEHARGLATLEALVAREPAATLPTESAVLTIDAQKP
jgi:ubiquinone/menaquinone biosynthesis C-methylase UbiE